MPTFAVGNFSSASSVYCTFTSRWRISACAHTLASRSVTVTRTSGFSSRTRATSSFARVMSALTVSWKTGACHAAVRRRAIVLRIFVSGTDSISPVGTAAGAADGAAASPRSTSSATMRPSGPVPRSDESSMPRSRAMRRASGEALMRPPFDGLASRTWLVSDEARSADASRPSSRSGSRSCASAGFSADCGMPPSLGASAWTSSPSLPM